MPEHDVWMSIEDADYLELIDNVEYKYLRHTIKNNLYFRVHVDLEDIGEQNEEGVDVMRATFNFDLNSDKEWDIAYNLTWTSCFGKKLNDLIYGINDDDETEDAYTTEDTDDIYSSPTSPRSVIN